MPLIDAETLAAHLAHADLPTPLVVCDVRFHLDDVDRGAREYAGGHVPGARFVDLHRQLADTTRVGAGRHPLPTVAAFTELLGRLGITAATHVVAYDAAGGAHAARLWWMLRSIGHGQVSVLDGGWPAWLAGGFPVSTEVPEVVATSYPPAAEWSGIVTADQVADGLRHGATVVDSRAPERYKGEVEPIDARAGHIPGAVNVFHAANLDDRGRFRTLPELVEHFAGVGDSPIVYCGSGVTACHNLLAMSLANVTGRLYPGSWSEWSRAGRPVASGDQP